ncbi:DNA-(apurinic or apyrimidinic site) endonuclease [Plutella xylostella]|uniref:DNA-(apurinic or apyrimidinic site) endonuclease n=1 Tax=Plutella xylostella TaxID=51655 RepID=UPI002032F939|nr:DNA-(apurinic or apyrimidinic site) endonuclease [Plutella xylostella]
MAPRTAKSKKTTEAKVVEDITESNGHSEEITTNGKAKKVKKDVPEKIAQPKSGRGKKATKVEETEEAEDIDVPEEKPKPAAKGRARKAQPKKETDQKNGDAEDEVIDLPVTKGRKKAAPKVVEENVPEIDTNNGGEENNVPTTFTKGRKKAAPKKIDEKVPEIETNNVDEENDVPATLTKGRKKAAPKVIKEKVPVVETNNVDEENDVSEEMPAEEKVEKPKKGAKGKKKPTKKAQTISEKEDEDDAEKEEPASKKKKSAKKEENGQGDAEVEEEVTEEPVKPKAAKGKRGPKKTAEAPAMPEDEAEDTGEPTTKRRRKVAEEKAPVEDSKSKAPLKNKASTNYDELDFTNVSKNSKGKEWNFKIASWNVDGIRAWMTKGGLDYVKYEKPDILCMQEVKCSKEKLPAEVENLPGYHAYWLCSDKDGYAGVGIYTTKLAMNVQYGLQNKELDSEGRIITAEYEEFYLICTYVPNAGRGLVTLPKRLQWNEEFRNHVKELDKKKPVIICGDMNVAHEEIDLANPKTNKKNAGFTEEERAGMTELLGDGFVDTYRNLNPDKTGAYTFWTYMKNSRSKNVGWRLDYFIVSERLIPSICDSVIRSEVFGSDHCPISLFLHLTSAEKPKDEQ